MLASLTIQNVVLVDRLTVSFGAGLCALTGETGAGKSVLLDSVGLVLGGRAEAGLVRRGADQAAVSAEFELPADHPVFAFLADQGIVAETPLILRRVVSADGRSRGWIGDQPVSAGLLRAAGAFLVEIHGQFETQGLLDSRTHRALLDSAGKVSSSLSALWADWQGKARALADAREKAARAAADEAWLRGALEDLQKLRPEPGEEEALSTARTRLQVRAHLLESLNGALECVVGADGADRQILQAQRILGRLGDKGGTEVEGVLAALDRASGELRDAAARMELAGESLDEQGASLEDTESRLFDLRAEARKHACRIDDLPGLLDTLAARLKAIESLDSDLAVRERETAQAREAYIAHSRTVRVARIAAAAALDRDVARELPPLKLDKARFTTVIDPLPEAEWGPEGTERVRFLVATNPGTEPGPIDKIASGGEMARFMLALKVVMARAGVAGTLVFDEVDSGIGGATADAVGERLARLARDRQVLVVTHAPQVAARADRHWIVVKKGEKEVRTLVLPLESDEARREEIARMLSGAQVTQEARAAAGRLLGAG
jgi:DNA repair protein RecN (Recombination protein N)